MSKRAIDHPALTPALRWTADTLCLWSLCGKSACRRSRTCSGAPRDCLARYAPLVPDEAREVVKLMLDGMRGGLSYHDLCDAAPGEFVALEEWEELVRNSTAVHRR